MSKSLGTKKAKIDRAPTNDYVNWLKNYDTSNVDTTLGNLTSWASNASQNLGDQFGNYTFNVEASDEWIKYIEDLRKSRILVEDIKDIIEQKWV